MTQRKPRILLIDDDQDVLDRVRQTVEGEYELVALADWSELEEAFVKERCALVLVDINLPLVKGDLLMKVLRAQSETKLSRPKLVCYSSADEGEMLRLVRETGADGYLSKRAVGETLLRAIAEHLKPG